MRKKYLFLFIIFGIFAKSQIGTFDPTFNVGTGSNHFVYDIAIQTDQKIVAVGNFTTFNGFSRQHIVRLNTDGSVDTTFNPAVNSQTALTKLVIQNDGKIVIGGYNSNFSGYIGRLNDDGSLDNSFLQPDMTYSGDTRHLILLPNQKILVAGGLLSNGHIHRLNTDGSLDSSFNTGNAGANNYVSGIKVLPNQKILIGGGFSKYNGTPRNNIAQLNADGTLDVSFDPGTGANSPIEDFGLQDDGKILIGGFFTSYNGVNRNFIARINADGSLDPTFNPGSGADDAISSVNPNFNGKILTTGAFTAFNGVTKNYAALLNPNGSLTNNLPDTTFDNALNTCLFQSDGKLVCAGYFSNFNGNPSKGVVRLIPGNLSSNEIIETRNRVRIFPNPVTDKFSILTKDQGIATVFDLNGRRISEFKVSENENTFDISNYEKGVYIIELKTNNKIEKLKIIKN